MIDLHCHSNISDGTMTPDELVKHAAERGLSAMALTDHDEVAGVKEAMEAGKRYGITVIPGIELSVQSDTETHILGYFIDPDNAELLSALEKAREVREERTAEVCATLTELGYPLTYDEIVKEADGGMTSRGHIAAVMVKKGYVESVKEAFKQHLAYGCPAYSGRQYLTAEQAVRLINGAGGRAYVAHLHLIKQDDERLFAFLKQLKDAGLAGIEGYYTDYTPQLQEKYHAMAAELGLSLSGGSDYHAANKPHIEIGVGTGELNVDDSVLAAMTAERDGVCGR